MNAAQDSQFGLLFITPGTPEQNLAECFFLFLKKEYRKLNRLAAINQTHDCEMQAVKVLLEALKTVSLNKFPQICKVFCN